MFGEGAPALDPPRRQFSNARLWWLYWLAWLPFAGVYAWSSPSELGWYRLSVIGLFNVVPAAIGGVIVIRRSRRKALDREDRSLSKELAFIFVVAALATLAVDLLFSTHRFLDEGVFAPYIFRAQRVAWRFFDRLMIYGLLAAVVNTVQVRMRLREEENRTLRAMALRKQTELNALRAQLQPHFLFNSLQSLISLTRRDPAKAEQGLTQMGDLFRHCLSAQVRDAEEVTLDHELAIIESYLSLERMRLGRRLQLRMDVDGDARACLVPVFSLQPLVENSVRHAISPRKNGGKLEIGATLRDDKLVAWVRDDGPGAPEVGDGNGHNGLRLIRERLEALYGVDAQLVIETEWEEGFTAWMTVPANSTGLQKEALAS